MSLKKPDKVFATISDIPVKRVYTPEDVADVDHDRDLGLPGQAPYVRGIYPNMYRERPWRITQLSGSGSPEDTRNRIKALIEAGERGITFEQDRMVCYSMLDVDDPDILCRRDDVGLVGAPIQTLDDLRLMLEGIPIEKLFIRWGMFPMQINFEQACYFTIAQERGIPLSELEGQSHGGMFCSYIGNPTYKQVPPEVGNRFVCDGIEFCIRNNMKKWVPSTAPGHNARENGINAYQEIAMVFSCQTMRIEELLARGLKIDEIGARLAAVNFAVHDDFFEEICKIRAARRMWYKLLKDKYGAENPRALSLRMHGLTCSETFTYQQPLNNIARNTSRSIAAALAGVQALGTAGYDEAIGVPTEEAAINAIRTQQIVQHELGITNTVDPLAGSYYVEWLTNELEKRAWEYLKKIEDKGGFIACLNSGWFHSEAATGMNERERKIATGEWKWVGGNCYLMEENILQVPAHKPNPNVWKEAMARLEKHRKERDNAKVKESLDELRSVAQREENILPTMMKAVQAGVTVGEVGNLWRELFGVWKAPLPI